MSSSTLDSTEELRTQRHTEVTKSWDVAHQRVFQRCAEKYLTDHLDEVVHHYNDDALVRKVVEWAQLDAEERDERRNSAERGSQFCLVTVNPDPKLFPITDEYVGGLDLFMDACREAFTTKKWQVYALWSFEFYTANGPRLHCHGLLKRGSSSPSDIKREIRNTLTSKRKHRSDWFPHPDKAIHFKWGRTPTQWENFSSYDQGKKDSAAKQELSRQDQMLRQELDIQHVYAFEVAESP